MEEEMQDRKQLLDSLHDANKRWIAEEAAKKRDNTVHNEQIKSIKEEIEDKLWWSPFVDESGVSVSVEDGIVTLIGVVEDLKERRDATRNAYEGGAREVRNFLKVKQGPKVLAP